MSQVSDIEFVADPATELCDRIARLAPANPFYTNAYVAYRRSLGHEPFLLLLRNNEEVVSGCTAFLKSGRLDRSLEITSLPRLGDGEVFRQGLSQFCRSKGVSELVVCTFASPSVAVPRFENEHWRKWRVEYALGLVGPEFWRSIRKGHMWNIKQARKSGLTIRTAADHDACVTHARLIEASMTRRSSRGEEVSIRSDAERHWALVRSGVAELFQAVRAADVVSSNLVLLSAKGGYNHSQGTSPEGMAIGAAHFLIYEIANTLRDRSFEVFNLGGTDQIKSGLERSKDGFGLTTTKVELESAAFSMEGRLRRVLKSTLRSVAGWSTHSGE